MSGRSELNGTFLFDAAQIFLARSGEGLRFSFTTLQMATTVTPQALASFVCDPREDRYCFKVMVDC
tara:strand:+ start:2008 stop:2205 length:198 start_codon:yes stop_codon:yes gene_type:complete